MCLDLLYFRLIVRLVTALGMLKHIKAYSTLDAKYILCLPYKKSIIEKTLQTTLEKTMFIIILVDESEYHLNGHIQSSLRIALTHH